MNIQFLPRGWQLMAAIHKLPVELISVILSDHCSTIDLNAPAFLHAHAARLKPIPTVAVLVCRRWHDIIQNAKNLFYVMCLTLDQTFMRDKTFASTTLSTYRSWLSESPEADVDLIITDTSWYRAPQDFSQKDPFLLDLCTLLPLCLNRLRMVCSDDSHGDSTREIHRLLQEQGHGLQRLLLLSFNNERIMNRQTHHNTRLSLDLPPHSYLRSFTLRGAALDWSHSSFLARCSSLDLFSGISMPHEGLAIIFSEGTCVTRLSLTSLHVDLSAEAIKPLAGSFKLHILRYLSISYGDLMQHECLLGSPFPALESVTVIHSGGRDTSLPEEYDISAHTSRARFPSLKQLHLTDICTAFQYILQAWEMPNLENLSFRGDILISSWFEPQVFNEGSTQNIRSIEVANIDSLFLLLFLSHATLPLLQRVHVAASRSRLMTVRNTFNRSLVGFRPKTLRSLQVLVLKDVSCSPLISFITKTSLPTLETLIIDNCLCRQMSDCSLHYEETCLPSVGELRTERICRSLTSFLAGYCRMPSAISLSLHYLIPYEFGKDEEELLGNAKDLHMFPKVQALSLSCWHPQLGATLLSNLELPQLHTLSLSHRSSSNNERFNPLDWKEFTCNAAIAPKLKLIKQLTIGIPPGVYTFTRSYKGYFSLEAFPAVEELELDLTRAKKNFFS